MKIAYVYPEKLPDRKARAISALNTVKALGKLADTAILYEKSASKELFQKTDGIKEIRVGKEFLGIKSNKIFNFNLMRTLKKEKVDIFYVRHLKAAKFLLKEKPKNSKLIFECHEIFSKANEKIYPLEKFVYENSDALTFINATLSEEISKSFDLSGIPKMIVDNGCGFDLEYEEKDFANLDSLFYAGNFYPWKGVDFLIRSLKKIDGITLRIAGSGEREETLKALVNELGLEKRVAFLGQKSHDEIRHIMRTNRLAVIPNTPSRYNHYSTPIKLYEYLASSNIVIAPNMPTIQEIVVDGENGFLFKTGDMDSFVDTLRRVLATPPDRLREISHSAYITSKNYTWEKRAEKIVELANSLLDSKNQSKDRKPL